MTPMNTAPDQHRLAHRIAPPPAPLDLPEYCDTRLVNSYELCQLAAITYRQLDYWLGEFRHHAPIAVEADGSGTKRLFRALDAPKYHVVGELAGYGLGPGRVWRELDHQQRLRVRAVLRKYLPPRRSTRGGFRG